MNEMPPPPDPAAFARMTAAEIRAAFLIDGLFAPGQLQCCYTHMDRAVIGTAVPAGGTLLLGKGSRLAAEYFTERREIGVINIGGPGMVEVGQEQFGLAGKECLYIGRGHPRVAFSSAAAGNPAQFYFVSHPAHAAYPCTKIGKARAESKEMGSQAGANRRVIHKLIHPGSVPSCQLTMGYTELAEGSVWNTMPAHTHARRTEIYLYFDLRDDDMVVHCMGVPNETRHILVRNRQVVLSPPWSLHFGAGTRHYSFVWSMGGENQEFGDMDMVSMSSLM